MELLYVWIERFNNIVNQGFCLSPDFEIKFDIEHKTLEIKNKERKPIKLFNEAFLNITAIVGKNGSGKTSFISFLKTIFTNEVHIYGKLVLLVRNNNTLNVIHDYNDSLKISGEVGIKELSFQKWKQTLMAETILISHSNSFSIYPENPFGADFIDISFNNIIDLSSYEAGKKLLNRYDDFVASIKPSTSIEAEKTAIINSMIKSHIPRTFFYQQEILSNFSFITEYHETRWRFIPNYIDIGFNTYYYLNKIDFLKSKGLEGTVIKEISNILFKKHSSHHEDLSEEKHFFKNKLIIYLFIYYITNHQYKRPTLQASIDSFLISLNRNENSEIEYKLLNYINGEELLKNEMSFRSFNAFISSIDGKFDSLDKFGKVSNGIYYFPITNGIRDSFKELFDIWQHPEFIFSLDWHGLSTGESALLNLFSRINSIKNDAFKPNIWLLIDEGDLYLHPEWQRMLLMDLNIYLPAVLKNKKIQLILTSHSPFIVSDLPKENIVFLNRDKGLCKVEEISGIKQTFAANIHSLYTDAFFLEGGLIGEFAKQKINETIKILNDYKNYRFNSDEPKPEIDFDEIKDIISIIGEPILKNKLKEYFEDCVGISWDESLIDKKKRLKKELKVVNDEIKRL